jgi:putative hemolysin
MENPVIRLADGSLLIDAAVSLKDLKEDHTLQFPESPEYETLGGFLMAPLLPIDSGRSVSS